MEDRHEEAGKEGTLPVDVSGVRELVGYCSFLPEDQSQGACSLDIGPQHLNRMGLLHGGLVSMLLDNGCAIAVRRSLGNIAATVMTLSLTVNFVSAASGGRVIASGRATSGGRKLKFAEGELRHEDGRLLATASAVFKVAVSKESHEQS